VTENAVEEQMDGVLRRLALVLEIPISDLDEQVRSAFARWQSARVREFVPIFVERELRDRLSGGQPRIAVDAMA
jgi:hypothetical protein